MGPEGGFADTRGILGLLGWWLERAKGQAEFQVERRGDQRLGHVKHELCIYTAEAGVMMLVLVSLEQTSSRETDS